MFQVGDCVIYKKHIRSRSRWAAVGVVVDISVATEDERAELISLFGYSENDNYTTYGVKWYNDWTTNTDGSLLRKATFKKFQKSS